MSNEQQEKIEIKQASGADNPYALQPEQVKDLLADLVSSSQPYIDKNTNPDIGDFAIYHISGSEPASNICREIEGRVFSLEWGLPPEVTQQDFAPFEDNSRFFLLVDNSDSESSHAVGALRIADYNDGPTETISFFHEYFGEDKEVPAALLPDAPGEDLWDVVGIAVDPEYRNGRNSAWLYHALYRKSLEEGVNKWISNVTDKEMRNLRKLIGIPFVKIPEIEPAAYESPLDGKTTIFQFYNIDVSDIQDAVTDNIASREQPGREMRRLVAELSRIALLGKISPTE